uniref:Secreted protein n=1 Tax=Ascaris lumbricoides TaxID=6252 RepID=A0A0M3I0N1_ASCLU
MKQAFPFVLLCTSFLFIWQCQVEPPAEAIVQANIILRKIGFRGIQNSCQVLNQTVPALIEGFQLISAVETALQPKTQPAQSGTEENSLPSTAKESSQLEVAAVKTGSTAHILHLQVNKVSAEFYCFNPWNKITKPFRKSSLRGQRALTRRRYPNILLLMALKTMPIRFHCQMRFATGRIPSIGTRF